MSDTIKWIIIVAFPLICSNLVLTGYWIWKYKILLSMYETIQKTARMSYARGVQEGRRQMIHHDTPRPYEDVFDD